MADELRLVLQLVADGRLSPGQAATLIDALGSAGARSRPGEAGDAARGDGAAAGPRQVRIRVSERGRQVVNLRIPLAFADMAARMVPGLSTEQSDRIRQAVSGGLIGPILDVEDEDGDGVLISVE
ncbi:MAG: hypothetical protein DLM71_02515 [Chloroflexi bacterium]|nr:MAG: hypothetical protein DLM71_02515 [Chloroflexota bacterium]